MKVYGPQEIRNVALLGHGDVGKTTLASAMLFAAKATTRFGKVDEGTAPTDYEEDEIQRKISIATGLAFVEWNKAKINILDTPGYGNFIAEARGPLRASDCAAVLVNAVSGVEVMTAKGWEYAEEFDLPRLILVSKMDRENASFERTMTSIHKNFGHLAIPVNLPVGQEKDFAGVIDLVHGKIHRYATDESGAFKEEEIPADLKEAAEKGRVALVEAVAELDEKLMEKYFEVGDLTPDELATALKIGVRERKIFPVLNISGLKNIGVADLMSFLVEFCPSPAESHVWKGRAGENEVEVPCNVADPAAAFVFKTISDPQMGRISAFRVVGGRVSADANLVNAQRENSERMAGLFHLRGKEHVKVEEAQAGDIACVMKLKETQTGDTLCAKERHLEFPPVSYPIPAISFAVAPKTRGDEDKIMGALQRMVEEDPNLKVTRDTQTKELIVSGSGTQHVEVVVARVQHRYGVEMEMKAPKIAYKETIRGKAEVHARHKKQTGGHGQFADIQIRMDPLPRGSGFEFVDEIFGGSVPRNFIPAVEKGMIEALDRGVLAGYPVVDFRITLFDGGFHPVDSSEMAFKIAAHLGFKEAMEKCKPTLLEPVMNVEVVVPEECMGDVMGDLNSRRGRIQGMDQKGSNQVIKAHVPLAEMLSYASTLKSITGGRGSFGMEFSSYEEAPAMIQQKIVEDAKKAKEEAEKD
jgi:elongation factor G